MTLTFPQTIFEVISPKDKGGVPSLAEAGVSRQILGFCLNNCSLKAPLALFFEIFENPMRELVQKCLLLPTLFSLVLSLWANLQNVSQYTNSDSTPLPFERKKAHQDL